MYAKTLYKPNPPLPVKNKISAVQKQKVPNFFTFAKNAKNVADINGSCVNRIRNVVPRHKLYFTPGKGGRFNYRMLMSDMNLEWSDECQRIFDKYKDCLKGVKHVKYDPDDYQNLHDYQFSMVREEMFEGSDNESFIVDAIIFGIFNKTHSKRKAIFWGAFGDIVFSNLQNNLAKEDKTLCANCYGRFDNAAHKDGVCPYCSHSNKDSELRVCEVCGTEYLANKNSKQERNLCNQCYKNQRKSSTK